METANTISLATTFPTQARPYPMERLKLRVKIKIEALRLIVWELVLHAGLGLRPKLL